MFGNLLGGLLTPVLSIVGSLLGSVVSLVSGSLGGLLGGSVSDLLGGSVRDITGDVVDAAGGTLETVLDTVSINGVQDTLSSTVDSIA